MNKFITTALTLLVLNTFNEGICQTAETTPMSTESLNTSPNSTDTVTPATPTTPASPSTSSSPSTPATPTTPATPATPDTSGTSTTPSTPSAPKDYMVPPSSTPAPCSPGFRFDGHPLKLTEKEWKSRLTHEQFEVLRKGKKEPPFANNEYKSTRVGMYRCAGCLLALFSSSSKYDAGTGIPSFMAPICTENVSSNMNWNIFSRNKDVQCNRCDGHLGQVFKDGPPPIGKRYSINPSAIVFTEE